MPRCFIINRVSTEKQRDNLSITVQRALHPRIADQLGCTYTPGDIFDLDVSSTTYDKKKWQSVKAAVASGRYANGYAIFNAIDRYHRDKIEWFELLVSLLRFNIRVAIPDTDRTSFRANEEIPIKLYNADQFKDLIQLVFEIEEADNFKRKLRKKVKLAYSQCRDDGVDIIGAGAASFGHSWESARTVMVHGRGFGRWVANEEESKIVRLIFSKELKAVEMAQWLNAHGHKTKKGKHWTSTYIYRVRQQLRLCGKIRNSSGEMIDALNIEKIVSYKEFLRFQHFSKSREIHRTRTNRRYALIGLARCGYCHDGQVESNLTRTVWKNAGSEKARLYCQKKKWKAGPAPCTEKARGYSLTSLVSLVNQDLSSKLSDEEFLRRALEHYRRSVNHSTAKGDIVEVKRQILTIEKKISNLTMAVADGFDRSAAISTLNALRMEKEDGEARLAALEQPVRQALEIPSPEEIRKLYREFLSVDHQLADNLMLFRVHSLFIERIYVYADAVTIRYRFFPEAQIKTTSYFFFRKKIDVPRLLEIYDKKTMGELRSLFSCTDEAIKGALKREGITKNYRVKVDDRELVRLHKRGKTPEELATHFNCHIATIRRHL